MRYRLLAPVLLAGLAVAGCGGRAEFGEVRGTVTLDGAPVEGVLVYFMPDLSEGTNGPTSWGATRADGTYSVAHMRTGEPGACVGQHRVTCKVPPGAKDKIPERYKDRGTTPLLIEVRAGAQTVDLNLTSAP